MNIRPEIAGLATPLGQAQPWPGNPRRGALTDIADKLTHFGQYQAIIVQKSSGRIVVGNHRYLAARDVLGWTHMAMVFLDIDDDTAARMLAADNRSSDLGGYDNAALAEFLSALDGLDGTGWSMDEVDDLLAELAAIDEPPPDMISAPPIMPQIRAAESHDNEPRDNEDDARQYHRAKPTSQPVTPHPHSGYVEVILVYTEDQRAELNDLIAAVRRTTGEHVKTAHVILHAARLLRHAVERRHDPHPLTYADILTHAEAIP